MYHQIVGIQEFLDDDSKKTDKKNQKTFSNHDNFNEQNQYSQLQLKNQTNQSFTSFHCLFTYFNHYSDLLIKKSINSFNMQNGSPSFEKNIYNLKQILSSFLFSINSQSPSNQKGNTSKLITQQIALKIKEYQQNQAQKIQAHLLRSKRFHKVQSFKRQIFIHDIRWSKHFQIVELEVQLLNYKTAICILNQTKESSLHQEAKIHDKGTFGDIYFIRLQQESIAVKCITFPSEEHLDNLKIKTKLFGTVLKEYFFVLLFSELQIGPKAKTLGGFDMVFHQNCIEFATQVCRSVDPLKNLAREMTKSLFEMHMLKIIHRDVKPENILFSPTFSKHVFIDFGCTGILNEAIGEVTFTKFAGTAAYCTEELVQLLGQNHGFVDLYFNDMYGLKKSLTEFHQCNKSIIKQDQIISTEVADIYVSLMKFSLFREDYKVFYEVWKEVRKRYLQQFQILQEEIVKFLFQIPPSQFLISFYWLQIDQYIRENEYFEQLSLMYKNMQISFLMNLRFDQIKQDKFMMHNLIYKNIAIDNGILSNKQKEVQRIMLTKQFVGKQLLQQSQKLLNDFSKQNTLDRGQLLKYCFVIVQSTSLDSDKFQLTYKEKIARCQQALQLLSIIDKLNLSSVKILFSSPFKQFMPVMVFFHYFLFNIWTDLSSNQQYESMISVIGTFCLLGYPAKQQIPCAYLISHFLFPSNQNQQTVRKLNYEQKIQKILIFWQCRITSFYYSNLYSKEKFLFDSEQFCHQFSRYYENLNILMQPEQNQTNAFFLVNYRFYIQTSTKLLFFDGNIFDDLMNMLNSQCIKQMQQQYPKVKRWKFFMQIILLNFTQALNIKDDHSFFNFIQKTLVLEINRYSKRLFSYLLIYDKSVNCKNVNIMHSMLRKIDEVLRIESLSLRFQINSRFYLACQKKDIELLKQMTRIIKQELFSVFFKKQITQLDQFLNSLIILIQKILNSITKVEKDRVFQSYLLESSSFIVKVFSYFYQIIYLAIQLAEKLSNFRSLKFQEITFNKESSEQSIQLWINDIRTIKGYFSILFSTASAYYEMKVFLQLHSMEQIMFRADYDEKKKEFIETLQNSEKKGEFSLQMIQFVIKNTEIKQTIKQSSKLTSQFVELFLLNYYDLQNSKLDLILEEFVTDISIQSLRKVKNSNIYPYVKFYQAYYIRKILYTNYQLDFCQKLIQLYYFYCEKDCQELLFSDAVLSRLLINCFIFTEKSYRRIKVLLESICLALKKSLDETTILIFCKYLHKLFWCQCEHCLPRETPSWNPMKFIQYLHKNINMNNTIQNPYFSLVYFYSIFETLPDKVTCDRIIKFMLMSLPYLQSDAKRVITCRIQAFIYHSKEISDYDDYRSQKTRENSKQVKREDIEFRNTRHYRRKEYIFYETKSKKRSYDTFLSKLSMFVDGKETSLGQKISKLLTEKFLRYFQLKNVQTLFWQKSKCREKHI